MGHTMTSTKWSTYAERAWIIVGALLSAAVTAVSSACPRDVSSKAHSCFTSYSFHYQNVQNSPQKLCCGLDVETLRAFCQSYTSAIKCVDQLKEDCPADSHHAIDKAKVNLDGTKAGLHELCSDDSIIESYAMYQSCFTFAGRGSELCFQTHMNTSVAASIRFLSKVSTTRMDKFCTDMRNTVDCVKKNIRTNCGEEAVHLADILVKPMVRQSTDCDYSLTNSHDKATKGPSPGHHAYISDDHGGGKSKSGASPPNSSTLRRMSPLHLLMAPVFVAFLISPILQQ